MDPNGLLLLNDRIYVPSAGNLHTYVLQYNHDHILAGYFGQNKTLDTPGPASMPMYNNFVSPVSLVCDPSHNITSPIDLSNNSPSLNDHVTPFLWTSSRIFHHPPGLTLSWS